MLDIAGKPLNDSYHFGQTLINDEGRPYQQGVNNVTGFTARARGRPVRVLRLRGIPARAVRAAVYRSCSAPVIAEVDLNPLQPANPVRHHQPLPAARHLRRDEVCRLGLVGRQAEPVVGTGRGWRAADEQQCHPALDGQHQQPLAHLHSRCIEGTGPYPRRTTSSARSPGITFLPGRTCSARSSVASRCATWS